MKKQVLSRRLMPVLGGTVLTVLFVAGALAFIKSMGGDRAPQPPPVQAISIVVPPPPPPPPPELEPPPEPDIEEVEMQELEPEPVDEVADSDEPPPSDDLGLDAEGVAGADGFGLKAKKGGRGLLGGNGNQEAWYASRLEKDIQAALARYRGLRDHAFTVTLRLWVSEQGAVRDSELVRGTGNSDLDQAINEALRSTARISQVPPEDMQPITLRIVSRS